MLVDGGMRESWFDKLEDGWWFEEDSGELIERFDEDDDDDDDDNDDDDDDDDELDAALAAACWTDAFNALIDACAAIISDWILLFDDILMNKFM